MNITLKEYKQKFPNAKLIITWNAGLNKDTDERVKANSEAALKKHWSKTNKEEIGKKISSSSLGKKVSEETRNKISKNYLELEIQIIKTIGHKIRKTIYQKNKRRIIKTLNIKGNTKTGTGQTTPLKDEK